MRVVDPFLMDLRVGSCKLLRTYIYILLLLLLHRNTEAKIRPIRSIEHLWWNLLSISLILTLRDLAFGLLRQEPDRHKQEKGHDDHDQPDQVPIQDLPLDSRGK